MGGGKSCSVIGCNSRTTKDKKKHFYQFPKEQPFRDIWITFTRRGSDYEVKKSSCMCQDHFDPSCYVVKKKQQCLAKNSIPTIFNRQTPEGFERIVLTFDNFVLHYVEEDTLLNPVFDKEKREQELIEKRERKLKEIRRLCRFCFEVQEDEKLVDVNKMKDYAISPNEMLKVIGIDTQFGKTFSSVVCEECFQHIITIDGFRKRCQKAQNHIISDLQELDQNIRKLSLVPNSWFKSETNHWENEEDDDDDDDDETQNLVCNSSTVKSEEPSFQQIIIKEEKKFEQTSDDDDVNAPSEFDDVSDVEMADVLAKVETSVGSDELESEITMVEATRSESVKPSPSKSRPHNQRTYECFFCHVQFAGQPAYKSHTCPVKMLTCEVDRCGKTFKKLSGFNSHITKLHKLPKMSRNYCRTCRLSSVSSQEDFKNHCHTCETNAVKSIETSITCEECGKVCPTRKSYTIHVMFHKTTEPFPKPKKWYKKKRGVFMCDVCGKEFATARYLKDHVRRIHTAPPKTIFTCDYCGKTRATRYAMNKHIKNVHTYDPTPCKVCGKVFRNVTLVQAHMLYHKDSKRIHFCPLCPDKPPYWTAVALKRHQESNHGYGTGYECEICHSTYRTQPGLIQHRNSAHGNKVNNHGNNSKAQNFLI